MPTSGVQRRDAEVHTRKGSLLRRQRWRYHIPKPRLPPYSSFLGARRSLMRSQPCRPLTLDSGSRTTRDSPLLD